MAYAIAAYGLVIGTLVFYGVRVQGQRRQLVRAERDRSGAAGER